MLKNCAVLESRLPEVVYSLARLQKLLSIESCNTLTVALAPPPPAAAAEAAAAGLLPRLERLSISHCSSLTSIGHSLPPRLVGLGVSSCCALTALPDPLLATTAGGGGSGGGASMAAAAAATGAAGQPRLASLSLTDCPELASLPASLCRLPSLETLRLSRCGRLAALPGGLTALTGLTSVSVSDCGLAGGGGAWLSSREQVREWLGALYGSGSGA